MPKSGAICVESNYYILKNKPLPKCAEPVVEKMIDSGEQILFVIVGDLNLKGNYDDSALIFTKKSVVRVGGEESEQRYEFS